MEKTKKQRTFPFSNLSVRKKFLLLDIMTVLAVLLVWAAMLNTISKTQKSKYGQMEQTAVTVSEQIVNMTVENAVSIAKNIYTDESIYEFLNRKYNSSSDYYEAYYTLQRNTAMKLADTNIVNGCTIYTENPTILTGGNVHRTDSVKDEYWYTAFQKLGKSTVLCIDPASSRLYLVRRLDYMNIDEGESFVCMEIDTNEITKAIDSLDFDGELYIISGSRLLFNANDSIALVDDIDIKPDFNCITRNYYTLDIEYYAYARRNGFGTFVSANKILLTALLILVVLVAVTGQILSLNIRRRVKPLLAEYRLNGSIQSVRKGTMGSDEIGKLIDLCCEMSDRLTEKGSEFKLSSDSLMRRDTDYRQLFTKAIRADAELAVVRRLPDIRLEIPDEYFPLSIESALISRLADKYGVRYDGDIVKNDKWLVPAYSLVLIAEDIFEHFNCGAVDVSAEGSTAEIRFTGDRAPRSTDVLKLHAIFEGDVVCDDYNFDRNYRFNPYLRLKHCLGSNADIAIISKNKPSITFRITFQTGKGDVYDN